MGEVDVLVHLLSQSQPIARRAVNTYTKDGMFCVYLPDGAVEKYPLVGIFRVIERLTTSTTHPAPERAAGVLGDERTSA